MNRVAKSTGKLVIYLGGDRKPVSMTVTGIPEDVLEVALSVLALFGDRVSEAVVTTRENLLDSDDGETDTRCPWYPDKKQH